MKKLAFYMSLIVTGLLMAACNEDFKDWAIQKTYLPEDAITIPGYTASAASAAGIDLNAETGETVQLVNLSGAALPEGYLLTGVRAYLVPADNTTAEPVILEAANAEGYFNVTDLQEAVVKFYGIRPTARTFKAHIYADAIKDGQSALIDAGEIELILTPIAPIIEDAYYVTGNINGWDNTNTTYEVSNGGKDPYENPVYVVVIPAASDGGNVEFKLTPKSGLGGDWSECIAAGEAGKFNYHNNGGNLVIEADGSAYYRVTFNMLEQTWSATPVPLIEDAYYITGNVNGWNNSDTSLELTNGGKDPYEQPVFTVVIPAPAEGNIEFKVTPKSGLGGDWSKCLTAADEPGTFATDNKGGNLVIEAVEGAKFYRLSMNMMAQTYTVDALSFSEYFYEIGNESGWSTAHALYGGAGDGKYLGYYYLDGEFKFKPNADNWENDLEYVSGDETSGSLTDGGGPNCPNPGAGFYQINLDAGALTYNIVKVNSISIIGTVNGKWDTDTDLTYNTETGAWEITTELAAGNMKFRMNHDWTISWGGANGDPAAFGNLTEYNGKDLAVEAGTYKIQLYISYEGNNKVVMTKQ